MADLLRQPASGGGFTDGLAALGVRPAVRLALLAGRQTFEDCPGGWQEHAAAFRVMLDRPADYDADALSGAALNANEWAARWDGSARAALRAVENALLALALGRQDAQPIALAAHAHRACAWLGEAKRRHDEEVAAGVVPILDGELTDTMEDDHG